MKNTEMKDALLECNDIKATIMDKISEILVSNDIKFVHNNSSEIIISNKTKKEILDMIVLEAGVPKNQLKMILQFSVSNGNLFIRQKFN